MTGIIAAMTIAPRLPPYSDALTGLRGIAALWVLVFHLWQFTGGPQLSLGPMDLTPLAARGHFGVDLFFVLSGYLIGGGWVIARLGGPVVAVGRFWKRRFLRVFPAYWAQWLILAMLAWLSAKPFPMDATHALLSVTLTFNLVQNEAALNAVWWSLPVEWNFYVIAPLAALLFVTRRALPAPLLALVLASVLIRAVMWWSLHTWGAEAIPFYRWVIQLPGRMDQFALGMLVAHALALGRGGSERLLLLGGGVATLVLVWLSHRAGNVVDGAVAPWLFFQFTLFGCAFAALTAAAALSRSSLVTRLLANRPLVFAGTISYSLYLWHYPALQWMRQWARAEGWSTADWRWACAAVALSLVLGWVSYRLVEHPFLPQRRKAKHGAGPVSKEYSGTPEPISEDAR
ncbi:acyltransferase [Xanthomonadaceae bacterium XH05]|nr:acyltransferase [Xanthomonadaceae bacterium XH05]